jgi:Uma2 family endonuclease
MASSASAIPQSPPRPPLVEGDRLTSEEFMARYERMPGVRARLLDGVVHFKEGGMASPVSVNHGDYSCKAGSWLGYYALRTFGVRGSHDTTVDLGPNRRCQPDELLRIREEYGGRSRKVGKYLSGPPELVVEVAGSTIRDDLGPQKLDYERAGVSEYIVFALDPAEIHWHVLEDGRYTPLQPDADGIYRSRVLPGLWLDGRAFWEDDDPALLAALDRGLASPEHAEFVERLRRAAER